jgi:hypothetical protein
MSIYVLLLFVMAWLFARSLRRLFALIFAPRLPIKRGDWSDL